MSRANPAGSRAGCGEGAATAAPSFFLFLLL